MMCYCVISVCDYDKFLEVCDESFYMPVVSSIQSLTAVSLV